MGMQRNLRSYIHARQADTPENLDRGGGWALILGLSAPEVINFVLLNGIHKHSKFLLLYVILLDHTPLATRRSTRSCQK